MNVGLLVLLNFSPTLHRFMQTVKYLFYHFFFLSLCKRSQT